ncbi:MAG: hypothetical protein E6150_11135 [Prevotella bivia]|nr:hypothetical protein [Prevotella bivia]
MFNNDISIGEYRNFVKYLANTRDTRVFLNSDEQHALEVLVQLFHLATQSIKIFAGCLYEHVGNEPAYVSALSDFIENGGELRILLNKYNAEKARESLLFRRLAMYAKENRNIEVKETTVKAYFKANPEEEIHFTVVDSLGYRIETDIEKRTARCSFNDPKIAQATSNFFDHLYADKRAALVDIKNIF